MYGDRPWLHHYPSEVAPSFDYPRHNLGRLLVDTASRHPDKLAIEFMGTRITYKELLQSAYSLADGLRALGLRRGDRVALMLPNCPQLVIAYFGILLYGGIVVMTNPLYKEGELSNQLRDSGASMIIALDILYPRIDHVKKLTELRHIIVTSIADYLPFPKNIAYKVKTKAEGIRQHVPELPSVHRFKRLLSRSQPHTVCVEVDAEEDIALLQYTGGTTGIAKGVMLTHFNLLANTIQSSNWFYRSKKGEEIFLAALPCFHVFGLTVLLNQAIYLAGTLVLHPRFDSLQVLKSIAKHRASIFPGAPTMYIAINHNSKVKDYDITSIQACVSGSASLPLEVQETFEALTGGKLIEGYGLTEASPVTHANNLWGYRKLGSIGIPFPDTEAAVVDSDTGNPVPVGEIGELIVKGPQVMKGYWNRPQDTEAVLKEGWLYTGDMGKMDEEGFFYIVDRKKDMINASGFKVYPREVEEILFMHPDVKEAVVLGVPDPYRGETVKAFVVLKDGAHVSEDDLISFCRAQLSSYKIPRIVEFRKELPKTIIGKVLRRKLAEEEQARQSAANREP
ncbi:long-chain-fatty-acid--CoA ligase [Paenibacillus sp. 1001270B_150601_E10]|uniref:long-chain-fatty-acid--CoA ligase n=1 Tax=Paenibacillus sp. 1001270B_150601_E10 TaxID=2787079 RepID=UPI00189E9844|nr:long-chain fatty acid--CoA ligase [Paenibacillus sp. 1001270B_150601_E10]